MDSTHRPEFDAQLELLHESYALRCTDPRREAYWKGLGKMSLVDFGRAVEHCLSEHAPEKLPTVGGIWQIAKRLRPARARGALDDRPLPEMDQISKAAAVRLLDYISKHIRGQSRYGRCHWVFAEGFNPKLVIEQSMSERVAILVAAKNAYIARVRSEPLLADPVLAQVAWDLLMLKAEREIDEFVAEEREQGELL